MGTIEEVKKIQAEMDHRQQSLYMTENLSMYHRY